MQIFFRYNFVTNFKNLTQTIPTAHLFTVPKKIKKQICIIKGNIY